MAADKPKTMSIKLPMDVIESARIVTAYQGGTIMDLMAEILRPTLSRMEREELAKRSEQMAAKTKR